MNQKTRRSRFCNVIAEDTILCWFCQNKNSGSILKGYYRRQFTFTLHCKRPWFPRIHIYEFIEMFPQGNTDFHLRQEDARKEARSFINLSYAQLLSSYEAIREWCDETICSVMTNFGIFGSKSRFEEYLLKKLAVWEVKKNPPKQK